MAISLEHISLSFPDSSPLLRDLTATIPTGLIGMVGDNGTGKSTLARIIAGIQHHDSGTVTGAGTVHYVAQDVSAGSATVAATMGIDARLDALRRVLAGSTEQADYDTIGQDWDIGERAIAACARAGVALAEPDLYRPMSRLSGGQAMRVVLATAILTGADWLILDEPTNNLDADARNELAALLVARYSATGHGGALVISHDRSLLRRFDAITELSRTGSDTARLRVYGGDWDFYRQQRLAEEQAARAAAVDARKELDARRDVRIAQTTRAARANAKGAKDAANGRWAPLVAGNKKRAAQVSQARAAGRAQDAEAVAAAAARAAREHVRKEPSVHIDLPEAQLHPRADVLDLIPDPASARARAGLGTVRIAGAARVRLIGANGAGKSTLLTGPIAASAAELSRNRAEAGGDVSDPMTEPREGRQDAVLRAGRIFGTLRAHVHVATGFLAQRTELPGDRPAVAVVAAAGGDAHRARALLAALGLRGTKADQPCATLSGGERARVALARVLLGAPVPRFLVLDEPSNDVDVATADVLAQALADYRGALLVTSHDEDFVDRLGVAEELDVADLAVPSAHTGSD